MNILAFRGYHFSHKTAIFRPNDGLPGAGHPESAGLEPSTELAMSKTELNTSA